MCWGHPHCPIEGPPHRAVWGWEGDVPMGVPNGDAGWGDMGTERGEWDLRGGGGIKQGHPQGKGMGGDMPMEIQWGTWGHREGEGEGTWGHREGVGGGTWGHPQGLRMGLGGLQGVGGPGGSHGHGGNWWGRGEDNGRDVGGRISWGIWGHLYGDTFMGTPLWGTGTPPKIGDGGWGGTICSWWYLLRRRDMDILGDLPGDMGTSLGTSLGT